MKSSSKGQFRGLEARNPTKWLLEGPVIYLIDLSQPVSLPDRLWFPIAQLYVTCVMKNTTGDYDYKLYYRNRGRARSVEALTEHELGFLHKDIQNLSQYLSEAEPWHVFQSISCQNYLIGLSYFQYHCIGLPVSTIHLIMIPNSVTVADDLCCQPAYRSQSARHSCE